MTLKRLAAAATFAAGLLASALAQAQDAALLVHLLDYIAVDYGEAVGDGTVKSADEYREMTEFAANVERGVAVLASRPERPRLAEQAAALRQLVGAKASPPQVARAATQLREAIVTAYRVPIGPPRAPDLGRAAALFAEHCASCHGADGRGDGAFAKGMDPPPTDFHDRVRQDLRSIHGLYNTLTLGVPGTAMRAFAQLPEADRWGLAYLVSSHAASDAQVARGAELWKAGALREAFARQADITGRSAVQAQAARGEDAVAVLAYLRRNPALVDEARPAPITFARARIEHSLERYRQGDVDSAVRAALSAYLDGFERVEASLHLLDEPLVRRTELAMIDYRNALRAGAPMARAESLAANVEAALREAQAKLGEGTLSASASFLASFVILLREGLEAVLVVAALIAFLRRSGQAHAVPYLHAGWIAALLLGALTWYVATRIVDASGASREMTEGVAALVAAAMLLYVGFWLHDKSHAEAWQGFVMRGARSIGTGAAWGLAFMAFLAVYREVFETVLLYQALWTQAPGREAAILAGLGAALATLAAVTWAMLRFSVRLPLGVFFGASGILLAALAVVLAGNGVAALQEAGVVPVSPVEFVTVPWLGVHANAQALCAQAVLAALTIALLYRSRRR
jgi:high-affinity iron transporter